MLLSSTGDHQTTGRVQGIAAFGKLDRRNSSRRSEVPVLDRLRVAALVSYHLPSVVLRRGSAYLIPRTSRDDALAVDVDPFDALDRRVVSSELTRLGRGDVVYVASVVGASTNDLGAVLRAAKGSVSGDSARRPRKDALCSSRRRGPVLLMRG